MNAIITPNHTTSRSFYVRDPLSALSHFAGFLLFICLMPVMLVKASLSGADMVSLISVAVFSMSLVLLYGASSAYHTFDIAHRDVLKRIDHAMISVLIAGSYTPVCLLVLREAGGIWLLCLVWTLAILGLVIKMFFLYCPRVFSSAIYILLGWSCLLKFGAIMDALSPLGFGLLLGGGLLYTAGGVIYSMKFSLDRYIPGFGAHEVFHLFILAGSILHWIFIYRIFG